MISLPLDRYRPKSPCETTRGQEPHPGCARCRLASGSQTVCMPPSGQQGEDPALGTLLVVGAAPGPEEDRVGRPFSGTVGRYVRGQVGARWKGNVVYAYGASCWGGKERTIGEKELTACRPYLVQALRDADPIRILALGSDAMMALLGRSAPIDSVATGYQLLPKGLLDHPVPVVFLHDPRTIRGNPHYRSRFERELQEAIERPLASFLAFPKGRAYVVRTEADAVEARSFLEREGELADLSVDIESIGQRFGDDFEIVSIAFSLAGSDDAYVWPLAACDDRAARQHAIAILENPFVRKVLQNGKSDATGLLHVWGATIARYEVDTRLQRKLYDPDSRASLLLLSELVGMGGYKQGFEHDLEEARKVLAKEAKHIRQTRLLLDAPARRLDNAAAKIAAGVEKDTYAYGLVPEDRLSIYNGLDVLATARAGTLVERRLDSVQIVHEGKRYAPIRRAWDLLVQPANEAAIQMERWGVGADREAFAALDARFSRELVDLGKAFEPYRINPGSTEQIATLLYKTLRLPVLDLTDGGLPCTDLPTLEKLQGKHPIIEPLIQFRKIDKLRGTYARGFPVHIRPDGRIHCTINIDGARCMPAGELVLTSRGYLEVQQVQVGDQVITHVGRPRAVTETHVYGAQPIFRVTLDNGLSLRTTGNHQYRTKDAWRRADALRIGEAVQVHSGPEEWRPVDGWEFLISSWGRVRRAEGRSHHGPPKIRALSAKYRDTNQGHLKTSLERGNQSRPEGNRKDFPIHRLVANAFLPPSDLPEVRHLNGIPWDNTVGNLAWGTPSENRGDAKRHGTMLRQRAKLTLQQVEAIRSIPKVHSKRARGMSTDTGLAEMFGVSREMIRDIRAGSRWNDTRPPEEIGAKAEFHAARVVAIVQEPAETVYGLTVEEDASHVTGGIVTHNTGRCSVVEPNMNTIPTRSREGRLVKDCFIAQAPDTVLVELDQEQLELRVAAGRSGDVAMGELYQQGIDFHLATAQRVGQLVFGMEPKAIGKTTMDPRDRFCLRDICKVANFLVIYMGGPSTLATKIRSDVKTARDVMEAIRNKFPTFFRWAQQQIAEARRTGYTWSNWLDVPTRRRPVLAIGTPRDLSEQDDKRRVGAENASANTPIQGEAADLQLGALQALIDHVLKTNLRAKVMLTIYDSIFAEVHRDDLAAFVHHARGLMTSYRNYGVPLAVDVKVGRRWGTMEKYRG